MNAPYCLKNMVTEKESKIFKAYFVLYDFLGSVLSLTGLRMKFLQEFQKDEILK